MLGSAAADLDPVPPHVTLCPDTGRRCSWLQLSRDFLLHVLGLKAVCCVTALVPGAWDKMGHVRILDHDRHEAQRRLALAA